ncbi:galactose mutarotase [Marinilabiliaceae bacterium JC017]|nr:galactose mutarotase [Marinilabiliaceae bacterium JC017]
MKIKQSKAGDAPAGEINLFEIENKFGTTVNITNYGGIITSIQTRDKQGNKDEIVLGFDNPMEYLKDDYISNCPYLGAVVGRYANRIKEGKFTLNGKTYELCINNAPNHLHGGPNGLHQKTWKAEPFHSEDRAGVKLTITSPDMEEGFPGNLKVEVIYTLTNQNELVIDYHATTDKDTHINLTNHSYFTLNGCNEDVLAHQLVVYADHFTPKDETDIPTGDIVCIKDSPLDFMTPTPLGDRIKDVAGRGFDHNYVINGIIGDLRPAARVWDEKSGRTLDFFTTEPGFQLYTANYLDGSFGRGNKKFQQHYGFCLEAQHYPDSPNQPNFPSTLLKAGKTYEQTTIYRFGILD